MHVDKFYTTRLRFTLTHHFHAHLITRRRRYEPSSNGRAVASHRLRAASQRIITEEARARTTTWRDDGSMTVADTTSFRANHPGNQVTTQPRATS